MLDNQWANVIGLGLDAVGAVFLTYGLIISRAKALELGQSYLSGETDEENLQLPPVNDRLKQSRNAIIGAVLLVAGFLFQIYGSWPP
ncbi:MAG: hypothetical protein Q7T36_00945 [Fluviicoccus sp.]|uniref:hypothetical protein n=1 Tax=Fluviicoccus sp. TaxID=2003552 RepID=UPI00272148F6|nr:hypothetical protein [Fluviicoccus sp.]MDO8329020.1 hypothetical protein [Fluviicoccus sp.]